MVTPQVLDRQRATLGSTQVADVANIDATNRVIPPKATPSLVATRPAPAAEPAFVTKWEAIDRELEARLNRLVIEHHEFGGRTGINGPVPHIGLVSYGER